MIESESTRRLGESGAIHLAHAAFANLSGDYTCPMPSSPMRAVTS